VFIGGFGWPYWYPYSANVYPYPYPVYAPSVVSQPVVTYEQPPVQPPPVQREVVYPSGKYVLHGDGVSQPWQWIWIPTAPPAVPAPPAP